MCWPRRDTVAVTALLLTSAPLADPATAALLAALRDAFGPHGVAMAGFRLSGGSLPDCLVQHTLEGSRFDLSRLLMSDALRTDAPALTQRIDPDRLFSFALMNALHLCAAIGETLAAGGPSPVRRFGSGQAFALARAWVDELTGGSFDDTVVLHTRAAWSGWFGCEVWDRTWLVGSRTTGRVALLCLTGRTAPWLPRAL